MSILERAVDKLKQARQRELRRCYRSCFLNEHGQLTYEAEKVLADLRGHSQLFGSAIRRDAQGKIDLEALLRAESRREFLLRILSCLDLDPLEIGKLTEVDNA